ncbi:MAG: septum site-determining protein MinD, partial [Methanoregulaceae archaeon]|nr:septum site-determining protein MinD [Methanoregulaceae archaeon]
INRTGADGNELVREKMEKVLGVKVIGTVPDDPNIRKSASYKTPVVVKFPDSPASVAIRGIAAGLAGVRTEPVKEASKDTFVSRFTRVLFRGQK